MSRIALIKRRVVQAVSGALNFPAFVNAGIRQTVVAVLRAAEQRPAVRVELAPATLLVTQRPALAVSLAPMTALAEQHPAFRQVTVGNMVSGEQHPAFSTSFAPSTLLVPERPAFQVARIQFDLDHSSFVVTMTNDTGNTTNWTNPANAQGANNGVFATWANGLAILTLNNKMHGTTVAQPNRPASLVIDEVYLAVWGSWSGLPVVDDLLSGLDIGYRIGGITALDVETHHFGASSGSATADEVRIDNGAGAFTDTLSTAVTWANIALLQFYGNASAVAGLNPSYNVDALRLRVKAHETLLT